VAREWLKKKTGPEGPVLTYVRFTPNQKL
jgi:hypothetical protein